jgi:glycosyltransferase involved in cell wall biosynthesis
MRLGRSTAPLRVQLVSFRVASSTGSRLWQYSPVTPRVTAIIATYNWSRVLRYSIQSVLRQTFSDFELLVVGDGCTDDSERVVATIDDPRVRWINLPANTRHQSGPNNEGLRQARGEIVAYLGHDDLWLPHHLTSIVGALDQTNADLAYALAINVASDGSVWPVIPRPARGSFSSPLGMAHRRHVTDEIGGWRDYRELSDPPDVELWQRAHARGYTFTFVPRLAGIKFPASWRRGVYGTRPCHEQAAWLARIEAEPAFETQQLVQVIVSDAALNGLSYRDLAGSLLDQTSRRIRRRFALPRLGLSLRRSQDIDLIRRFKGL